MRVLFSITYYSPYVSGLTIYVMRMAEALSKAGHNVAVLCFRHDSKLLPEETIRSVQIVRVQPDAVISKGFLSIRWITQSYHMIRNADAVVINLPQFEGWITAFIAKILHKRIICVYHCEISLPTGMINKIIQYVVETANRMSLLLCDSIITYTQDYADHSKLLQSYRDKIVVLYPPVTKPVIDKVTVKRLNALIGNRSVTIGIAARLAKEKGIEYLFDAIPSMRKMLPTQEIKVVIAGPIDPVGETSYRQKITDLAERYVSQVVFLGTLSQDEIGAFYSLLDVLILPSINSTEAFGMVQVEAMLLGVPVVASDLPGVRVPIERTGMGIVVPIGNSSAIAEAIVKIVSKPKVYTKPTATIEKEFSMQETVDSFEKLLS